MADKRIEVRLLTPSVRTGPSQYKYQGEADMVIIRAVTGDIGFLHGHVPCSVVLDAGVLRILPGEGQEEIKLAVIGGVAQVENNVVTIISETAEWPEDIDRNRAITRRDEKIARMEAAHDTDERETLRREIRNEELLITVSGFPPSGINKENI
jgi:F-type H+-transporting ATPase subunit epsilon